MGCDGWLTDLDAVLVPQLPTCYGCSKPVARVRDHIGCLPPNRNAVLVGDEIVPAVAITLPELSTPDFIER